MDSKPAAATYNGAEFNTSSTFEFTKNEVKANKEETKRYELAAPREGKFTTSNMGAFLHVIKSSLGTGFLAMPYAFKNAGLLAGVLGATFVAFICAHCTYILIRCSQHLCYIEQKPKMTYSETVFSAFKNGAGKRLAKYAGLARHSVNFFMFVTYYGVNTVYVIFIATSFQQVIENHTDLNLNIRWYALALIIVLLPVGILKHMKFLVPFSAIANIFLLIGCSLIMYYVFLDLPPLSSRPLVKPITKWPLFFSVALFGMEGIGTVLPIENSMRTPKSFLGCPGVLNMGMTVIGTLFVMVGFFGYLRFGEDAQGSVSLNLSDALLAECVKTFVALAILFTYGLQLTASIEVVWDYLKHNFTEENEDRGYYIVRTLMILGTVALGILVPNLSPVLSLVGAFGFSTLGLFYPALTEIITTWDDGFGPFNIYLIKNIILIGICAFAVVTGSITSVSDIITQYS